MRLKNTLTAVTIFLLTGLGLIYLNKVEDRPLKKDLTSFPMAIGQWQGSSDKFDDQVYQVLGVDDSILANYRNPNGHNVQLYIGYYRSQREGDLIHSPKNCMPGTGWNIIESSPVEIGVKQQNGDPVKVIKLSLQNGINRQVVFYWFHSRGRVISSEYLQKVYLVWDSITKHRTDGSFVRIISPAIAEQENQTIEQLKQFTETIFPMLNDYIPS